MKHLLLLGGGHAHIEVLWRFAQAPPGGAAVTLVNDGPRLTYSGMLPGFIAGLYAEEEIHIDLEALAARAQCRFVRDRVTAIDAAARRVTLCEGATLDYDVLSMDVGAVPAGWDTPGAREHAVAVKPFPSFLRDWRRLLERARRGALRSLAVVGGGAAGVELALAMQRRLLAETGRNAVAFHLISEAEALLYGHNDKARRIFARVLAERGIHVHLAARVTRVEQRRLYAAGGLQIAADAVIWATGAGAPPFLAESGLERDAEGFVAVDEQLQSISHPQVFAAGDVAGMRAHPRPKSGVYAVRQGPPLAANLAAALAARPLMRHIPQRRALALITTGDRYAVASRGALAFEGAWVWRWKDRIDRRFVGRYRDPP